jgi:transposase
MYFINEGTQMERLEPKNINGNTYYYYSKWGWKNGKCRRIWQKYLGKLENIVKTVEAGGTPPLYAEVFQWGLPLALWNEIQKANIINIVDFLSPKRKQGITTGEYLAIAAVNRAISPKSKRSMWEWFSQTVLLRLITHANQNTLTSQRFWDHMARIGIEDDKPMAIWKDILKGVVKRESIDLSSVTVSYDGTNFYTFIDTFNTKCKIAKRGKNKQGRNNLRQISYALFCCADADGYMPLYYDIYEGNRNDAKQFPLMLKGFRNLLKEISNSNEMEMEMGSTVAGTGTGAGAGTGTGDKSRRVTVTLVFDKGNNSADNFALIDSLNLNYVGSVKLEEHKELAQISNLDKRFVPCNNDEEYEKLDGAKAFRVKKVVYGKERVLVVSYNQNLFNTQLLTIQNDIAKAIDKLSTRRRLLEDRANGLIKGGNAPTMESIEKQCNKILCRQYMKRIIKVSIQEDTNGMVRMEYSIDSDAIAELSDTYLGKNIIITNRDVWDDSQIIKAYRSQFIIENIFKQMKDRNTGSWWPLHHWTDSKIKVHALYCTIALLIRALMYRRIRQQGLNISMKRIINELDSIREVVNIYQKGRSRKKQPKQTVLTKTSQLQQKIMRCLNINLGKTLF